MFTWIIATFLAFFIKGLCGFANTLVFTSILGFSANNINISPVELVLGYPTNLILVYRLRKSLDFKIIIPISLIMIAGSIVGTFLLHNIDTTKIKLIFGAVIVLIGLEMFFSQVFQLKMHKPLLVIIGVLSGLLCGLFGIGALLSAYIGKVTKTSSEFKANISAVFAVENTIRILVYSLFGIITLQSLTKSFILFPFVLLGLFAGIKSANILNEKIAKKLVILLLIISGLVLIIKSI